MHKLGCLFADQKKKMHKLGPVFLFYFFIHRLSAGMFDTEPLFVPAISNGFKI